MNVEIIKLGEILGGFDKTHQILSYILIVSDGGELIDYYNKILMDNSDFKFQRTTKGGNNFLTNYRFSISLGYSIKGISDGLPTIGYPYTIDNNIWNTSSVIDIIEDSIIITQNSVYAIHNLSLIRDKKLKELGI